MLGVSGLRGLVGRSLTPEVAARYGSAVGTWFASAGGTAQPHIVMGRDSRPSGAWVAAAATAGLAAAGCRVTDLGIATTPAVAVMVEHLHADGGMVITASHNPIVWNGIKTLRRDGCAPPPEQAARIVGLFKEGPLTFAAPDTATPLARDDSAAKVHVERVLAHVDAAAIRAAKLTVVVDSVHGAGGDEAAMLLDALGVTRVHLYAEPTGQFPHPPEPTREHLTELAAAVAKAGAAVGFAQDPDADRLAVVDERGAYIGEEYTLALCAMHVLAAGRPSQANGPITLAANLSTSRMLDDLAQRHGGRVIRTPVGEASVAAAMRQHHALIGGEGNGGVIWPKVIHVRDSIAGMALILELLATRRQPLSALAAEIPSYAIVKDKVELSPGLDVAGVLRRVAAAFPDAGRDTQDGVRLDWPDRWVHVRASNTEPILRFIAEARDAADAHALIDRVRQSLVS